VFIGIKGTALAIDRATGAEVWRTALSGADYVNVAVVDDALYASARGEIYALEPATGEILWHNPLKGLGRGLLTIAGAGSQAAMGEKKRRDAQAAAAGAAAAGS
jgi:outer membrane protein assembly factor BamB